MFRCLPGALDPGAPPEFRSPDDVIAWVRAVDWLVAADRAVVLHVDSDYRLTCVASTHSRLQYIGPLAKDAMALEALQCGAAAVLAVDVRRKLPTNGVSNLDRRRHANLRLHLAIHGVALLDTVVVVPQGGVSVTGSLSYPLGGGLSWLQVHVPLHRLPISSEEWSHEPASEFPPGSVQVRDMSRPKLWIADDPGR